MRRWFCSASIGFVLALLIVPAASAATITFNGLGLNTQDPVVVDGFEFDYQNRDGWAIGNDANTSADFGNGTDFILCRDTLDRDCVIRMEVDGGGVFSLQTFDGADVTSNAGGRTIQVTGFLFGGGTVMQSFLTIQNAFAGYVLPASFMNLVAVEFRGFGGNSGDQMALDNIQVEASATVPEPGTLLLLGTGLGLAARRRRRA